MSLRNRNDPETVTAKTTYQILPDSPIDSIPKSATTPSVLNRTRFKCINTGAITVTNFTGGAQGQTILLLGEGFTTIKNNTTIKTNTAADKLLAVNKVYTFTLFGTVWVENA